MQCQYKSSDSEGSSESTVSIPPRATSLNDYIKDANTTKSGILWTLKTVMKKSSLQSCEQLKLLFVTMFPDSTIAKILH